MSRVKCEEEKNGQSGRASRWRVCYLRGLPRVVYGVAGLLCKAGLLVLSVAHNPHTTATSLYIHICGIHFVLTTK